MAESQVGAPTQSDAPPQARRSTWRELPMLVLIAFVLALLLKTFVVQAFYIPSASMEPTLQIGDRVLVNKLAYTFREPRRGEIVVFAEEPDPALAAPDDGAVERFLQGLGSGLGLSSPDERDFIKRIIGLPGDVVAMRDGVVHVNGQPLPEALAGSGGYLAAVDRNDFGPVTVRDGHYFVMGDNRPNSSDSRFSLGQVRRDAIVGRAFLRLWPLTAAGTLPIASYEPPPPAAAGGNGGDDVGVLQPAPAGTAS